MSDDGSFSSNNEDSRQSQKLSSSSPQKMTKHTEDGNGARKRKRNNPVRLPSVPDDSADEFCCYDDGTIVTNEDEDTGSPKRLKEDVFEEKVSKSQNSPSASVIPAQEGESGALALDLAKNATTSPSKEEEKNGKDNEYNDRRNQSPKHQSESGRDFLDRREQQENDKEDDDARTTSPVPKSRRDQDQVDHLGRLQNLPIFSQEENDSEGSSEELGKSDDEENTGGGSPNSSSK